MRYSRQFLSLIVVIILAWTAEASTFDHIRYNGGTLQTKVDPKDWDNTLTVTPEFITLRLKDGQTLTIDPRYVTNLSYGQEAHRRVGTMIALGILVAPLALFGLFHKTRLHFIGIEYSTQEGRQGGLLLQAHKDNYRGVLQALRGATNAPVAVAPEDQKFIASAIGYYAINSGSGKAAAGKPTAGDRRDNAAATKDDESRTDRANSVTPPTPGASSEAVPKPAQPSTGMIKVTSEPSGASVFVDEGFVGMTPCSLPLMAGIHKLRLFLNGYRDWSVELKVLAGSEVSLPVVLVK